MAFLKALMPRGALRMVFRAVLVALLLLSSVSVSVNAEGYDEQWTVSYWNLSPSHWYLVEPPEIPAREPDVMALHPIISFDWSNGAPMGGVQHDRFVVRAEKKIMLTEAESISVKTVTDDGVRVWVNDQLVIDEWNDHSRTEHSASIQLPEGHHNVVVEYYENGFDAVLAVDVSHSSNNDSAWMASYWEISPDWYLIDPPAIPLSEPNVKTMVPTLHFMWGQHAPHLDIRHDRFMARFERQVMVDEPGDYYFSTLSDDGVRVYVDGQVVINEWDDHSATKHMAARSLAAGEHTIAVEYYENGFDATLVFDWGPMKVDIPTHDDWAVQYWNLPDAETYLLSPPVVPETQADATTEVSIIDFDWGMSSPHSDIQPDRFIARYRKAMFLEAGKYDVWTRADDGTRVYVNNELVLDNWMDQSATEHHTQIVVPSGNHDFTVEYYENGYDAALSFGISPYDVEDHGDDDLDDEGTDESGTNEESQDEQDDINNEQTEDTTTPDESDEQQDSTDDSTGQDNDESENLPIDSGSDGDNDGNESGDNEGQNDDNQDGTEDDIDGIDDIDGDDGEGDEDGETGEDDEEGVVIHEPSITIETEVIGPHSPAEVRYFRQLCEHDALDVIAVNDAGDAEVAACYGTLLPSPGFMPSHTITPLGSQAFDLDRYDLVIGGVNCDESGTYTVAQGVGDVPAIDALCRFTFVEKSSFRDYNVELHVEILNGEDGHLQPWDFAYVYGEYANVYSWISPLEGQSSIVFDARYFTPDGDNVGNSLTLPFGDPFRSQGYVLQGITGSNCDGDGNFLTGPGYGLTKCIFTYQYFDPFSLLDETYDDQAVQITTQIVGGDVAPYDIHYYIDGKGPSRGLDEPLSQQLSDGAFTFIYTPELCGGIGCTVQDVGTVAPAYDALSDDVVEALADYTLQFVGSNCDIDGRFTSGDGTGLTHCKAIWTHSDNAVDMWHARYWNMPADNFTAPPDIPFRPADVTSLTRTVNYAWADQSLGDGLQEDFVVASYELRKVFEPGRYRLSVTSDDGVRAFLDGRFLLEESWNPHPEREDVIEFDISSADEHTILVEYYEATGDATIIVNLERIASL